MENEDNPIPKEPLTGEPEEPQEPQDVEIYGSIEHKEYSMLVGAVRALLLHAKHVSPVLAKMHTEFEEHFKTVAMVVITLALLAGPARAQAPVPSGAIMQGVNILGGINLKGTLVQAPLGAAGVPVVTVQGTAGSTSVTYYCQAVDNNGALAPVGSGTTVTTSNATRTATNLNVIVCPGVVGAAKINVWSGGTSGTHLLGTCSQTSASTTAASGCFVDDIGQALTAGTNPAVDQTGGGVTYNLTQTTSPCSTSGVLANTCSNPTVTLPAAFSTAGSYTCVATCTQGVTGEPIVENIKEAAASPKIQVVIAALTAATASCSEVSIQCGLANSAGN